MIVRYIDSPEPAPVYEDGYEAIAATGTEMTVGTEDEVVLTVAAICADETIVRDYVGKME